MTTRRVGKIGTQKPDLRKLGEETFAKQEKINSELFALTYGAVVVQILKDCKNDVQQANAELHKMGYNIGIRLIDEFLVKTDLASCLHFQESAEVIAKVGLKMFLNLSAEVVGWSEESKTCTLRLPTANNPFIEFAEIPEKFAGLVYGNLLCGVIKGALEMVQISADCFYSSDPLRGDEFSEIQIVYKEFLIERVDLDL